MITYNEIRDNMQNVDKGFFFTRCTWLLKEERKGILYSLRSFLMHCQVEIFNFKLLKLASVESLPIFQESSENGLVKRVFLLYTSLDLTIRKIRA